MRNLQWWVRRYKNCGVPISTGAQRNGEIPEIPRLRPATPEMENRIMKA